MRTTLNIDDDVLERAKDLAHLRQVSVGEALSELARRGMEVQIELKLDPLTGLMVLHSPGARSLTLDEVKEMQDDDFERHEDLMRYLRQEKRQ
ncbi:MAG: hypothetical protein RL328_2580 [Acidobacteriota bacterium]